MPVRPVTLCAAPVLAVAAVLAAVSGTPSAAASEGSVPAEVAAYVEDGGLVERLADVYGPDESGSRGVDFDETTETGPISRVFLWTDARLAGEQTEEPIRLVNEWVVPITIAEEPVGLATVWINPETVAPELAEFVADPELAVALSDVPDEAALVRDEGAEAWFALEEGTVTPLVTGRSGLQTPAPLDEVAIVPPVTAAAPPGDPHTGTAVAVVVVVVLVLVTVVALIVPGRHRRRADEGAPAGTAER